MMIKIGRRDFERQAKEIALKDGEFVYLEGMMLLADDEPDRLARAHPEYRAYFGRLEYQVFRELYYRKGAKVSRFVIESYTPNVREVVFAIKKKLLKHDLPFQIFHKDQGYTLVDK